MIKRSYSSTLRSKVEKESVMQRLNSLITEKKTLEATAFGKDALHKSIMLGDIESFSKIIEKVKKDGGSLEGRDYLNWAVEYKRYRFITPLILSGCIPYISQGHDTSILEHALQSKDGKLLREVINACQRCKGLMSSPLVSNKTLLSKSFKRMNGKEKVIFLISTVKYPFSKISFYLVESESIAAYALYNEVSLDKLSNETSHEAVKEKIKEMIGSS